MYEELIEEVTRGVIDGDPVAVEIVDKSCEILRVMESQDVVGLVVPPAIEVPKLKPKSKPRPKIANPTGKLHEIMVRALERKAIENPKEFARRHGGKHPVEIAKNLQLFSQ